MSTGKLSSIVLPLCVFIYNSAYPAYAACETRSGFSRAELIELYTSEGCSSCPPADRWMSGLVPAVASVEEVVPLAFHVDYWDRLGWRDRFADPAYTARQYAYSRVSGSSFVFTPQFVFAGRNFRDWPDKNSVQLAVRNTRAVTPDATIVLRQQPVASGKLVFEVMAQLRQGVNSGDVRIYAALFQNGLASDVARGENSGSRLRHDYVVRILLTSNSIEQSGKITFKQQFTLPDDAQLQAMGVAVFAQDSQTGTVLQAMSASLCVAGK